MHDSRGEPPVGDSGGDGGGPGSLAAAAWGAEPHGYSPWAANAVSQPWEPQATYLTLGFRSSSRQGSNEGQYCSLVNLAPFSAIFDIADFQSPASITLYVSLCLVDHSDT